MPGPIISLTESSNDSVLFESCEDGQEAWGGFNGNFSQESIYHDCNKHYQIQYVNGDEKKTSTTSRTTVSLDMSALNQPVTENKRDSLDPTLFIERTIEEDMELENEVMEEPVESIDVPVVEASLSVDINTSLTRQKISSVQRGRTLSYVDKDDSEEAPTRRPHSLTHVNESAEAGSPLHPIAKSDIAKNGKMPPSAHRAIRVVRNPSYHFAVRDSAGLSPQHTKDKPDDQQSRTLNIIPASVDNTMQTVTEDVETVKVNRRHTSVGDEMTHLTESLATNMSRSVSFSGPESLSPTVPGRGSLSEGNSRSGSASQLLTPSSQSATPLTLDKPSASIVRGSVITRSFRRLFSNPARSPTSHQTEELWLEIPEQHNNTDSSERKSPSRLRRISSNLSRRLSNRTPKMATSSGTNGQCYVSNGATTPEDVSNLVEYNDLLKLFRCSGCQSYMTPPLYQCRKGHLVCNTCRFSLKQVCPMCKQRFADNTNMMMEQVCQLVKFPCTYATQGCPEFHRPRNKQDHEHFCVYRPVHCHHGQRGCPKVLLLRDMHEHLDQCEYKSK